MTDITTDMFSGFAFGQSEKLTTRIRGLIHDYPEGVGIIKELLQNADDASAQEVQITIDWNYYPAARLPSQSASKLQGPALLIYNDKPFTAKDLADIQQIGNSGKIRTAEKTGRFGLGFNSVYNVTDWPGFVTGDSVLFFDPHCSAISGATPEHPGRGWRLAECWLSFPDLLLPFVAAGLPPGVASFPGTIFRLPLRSSEQARVSEISTRPFGRESLTAILEELAALGGEILLFLKNVEVLRIFELTAQGNRREVLSIVTQNAEEVRRNRAAVFPSLRGDTVALIQRIRAEPALRPSVTYAHEFRTVFNEQPTDLKWLVVSGLFLDPEGKVLSTAEEMIDRGEKAIPLAGVAAPLGMRRGGRAFRGRAYCSLPLNVETGLPVHVNGFFDLDSARHTLTLPGGQTGKDRVRGKWNEILATHVIPRAYAKLIEGLAARLGDRNPRTFYSYWPDVSAAQGKVFEGLAQAVYGQLAHSEVIRSATPAKWAKIDSLWLIPTDPAGKTIEPPLVAEGFPVPFPSLPQKIIRGFKAANARVQLLQPADLRARLRVGKPLGMALGDAPRTCLKKKRWVKALLLFCLGDSKRDLRGLPLAIMSDGTLQAFGFGPGGKIFLATKEQRRIFAGYPQWFLQEAFAGNCKLEACPDAGLVAMGPTDFLARLREAFAGEDHAWEPEGTELPNAEWLGWVYEQLTSDSVRGAKPAREALQPIPLVPNQWQVLCRPGFPSTPLFLQEGLSPELRVSLEAFRIPLVTAPPELHSAVEGFVRADLQNHIWPVTGPDVLDVLADHESEDFPAYTPRVYEPLLDYLSEPRWVAGTIKFSVKHVEAARNLSVFPTIGGGVTALGPTVFMPGEYAPPAFVSGITLLRVTTGWRPFYDFLGVQTLGRATLIRKFLLPTFRSLPKGQRLEALAWIRDNLDQAIQELDQQRQDSGTLLNELAEAEVISGSDGELHSAQRLYDPESQIVRDVLGASALFPDMVIYREGHQHWLRFFVDLGLLKSPQAPDLLAHVQQLVAVSLAKGIAAVTLPLRRVFEHLLAETSLLQHQADEEGRDLGPCLAGLKWLPAERDASELGRYPGFAIPEDRLFAPGELQLVRNAHLIASQCPIFRSRELETHVRQGLGFPAVPDVHQVLAHFDTLIALQQSEGQGGMPVDAMKQSLRAIYSYLSTFKTDGTEDSEGRDDSHDGTWIRDRYENKECLWQETRFWKPIHAFQSRVAFFAGRRVSVQIKPPVRDAYELLGMKKEPVATDFITYLRDLTSECDAEALDPGEIPDLLEVYRRLGRESVEQILEPRTVDVLTDDLHFRPADALYRADAPWFEDRLDRSLIVLAHRELPESVLHLLKIRSLARSLEERVAGELVPSNDMAIQETCTVWQRLVQSAECRNGLIRLLRHEGKTYRSGSLEWLNRLSVVPVQEIQTDLFVERDGQALRVGGGGTTDFFYSPSEYTVYLNEDGGPLLIDHLAKALNGQLDDGGLQNLQPFTRVLNCHSDAISELLDRLRIRPCHVESEATAISDSTSDATVDSTDDPFGSNEDAPDFPASTNAGTPPNTPTSPSPTSEPFESTQGEKPAEAVSATPFGTPSVPTTTGTNGSWSQGSSRFRGGTGRSRTRQSGSGPTPSPHPRTDPAVTYVSAWEDGNDEADADNEPATQEQRMRKIKNGRIAVARACRYERRAGRQPSPKGQTHEGFDIESIDRRTGEVRKIEVKGINGPWTQRGIHITKPQFEEAQRSQQDHWLYVVEYALERDKAKVHAINNPYEKINQFWFDNGWRALGESPNPSVASLLVTLDPGMKIVVDGKGGTIAVVENRGAIRMVTVSFDDGTTLKRPYNPLTMPVTPESGGGVDG